MHYTHHYVTLPLRQLCRWTKITDGTNPTLGSTSNACAPTVRDNAVIELIPAFFWHEFHQCKLYLDGILRFHKTQQIGDPGYMRINGDTGNVETIRQDAVGSLPSNAG